MWKLSQWLHQTCVETAVFGILDWGASLRTAIAFFVFSVSKGASVDPSVDTCTNKRLRSVAVAQVCAILGAPCGNIRDLVADSEEGE